MSFTWNVTLNETDSCYNQTDAPLTDSPVSPNTSAACGNTYCGSDFESVSTGYKVICPTLRFENDKDALNIDLNITVPMDAPAGGKVAGIIVRGTTTV